MNLHSPTAEHQQGVCGIHRADLGVIVPFLAEPGSVSISSVNACESVGRLCLAKPKSSTLA